MRISSLHLVLGVLLAAACLEPARREPGTESPDRRVTDRDIAFFEARVAHDPYGARDRAQLGALYLARARRDGSEEDLRRAETLARESRRVRGRRNAEAMQVLASALMAQHRFREAHDVMQEVVAAAPDDAVARATLAEIALELGQYQEADTLFRALALRRDDAAIGPRYARWLEINGHSGEARLLLERVRGRLEGGFRVPAEQLAWFDLRLGELAIRNERPDLGEEALRRGLALAPGDPALLTALARLRGYRGEWTVAVELANDALAARFDPATLALLAEAYATLGDSAQSAENARAMSVAVSRQLGGFHRGWALFLLDHGGDPNEVLQRAEADHQARHDVYGHDLMGWALYRAGRGPEARVFADSALALGTRDALLWYHSGVIALATGDTAAARTRLSAALESRGQLRPDQAEEATRLLREPRP